MKRKRIPGATHLRGALHLIGLGLLLLLASVALAQPGEGYDLSWSTVDGGGTFSTGEGYSLGGTAGQPDASLIKGGDYPLAGGFWPGGAVAVPEYYIYLPLVVRNH
jgi:hypothetical protein